MKRRAPIPAKPIVTRGRPKAISEVAGQQLTPREMLFLREYVKDWNGSAAALRAGLGNGKPNIAGQQATIMLRMPHMIIALHHLLRARTDRMDIKSDEVAKYWYTLATADARELMPVRKRNCRYCWGIDYQYQFTDNELRQASRSHRMKHTRTRLPPMFDELGGGGYDQTKDPNHDCPECRGVGVWNPETIDLDQLSPGAAMLFDGLKYLKDGSVEVKIRDRSQAMRNFELLMGFIKPRRGLWEIDFDQITSDQLVALLNAARARGLLSKAEVSPLIEGAVTKQDVDEDEIEDVPFLSIDDLEPTA